MSSVAANENLSLASLKNILKMTDFMPERRGIMRNGNRLLAALLLVLTLSIQPLFASPVVRAGRKAKLPAKTPIAKAAQRNTGCYLNCEHQFKKCLRGDFDVRDRNGRVIKRRSDHACQVLRKTCRDFCRNP